jgi:hypothetical protein
LNSNPHCLGTDEILMGRVALTVVWFDDDVMTLTVTASSGDFGGRADIYTAPNLLISAADHLDAFPSSVGDHRTFVLSTTKRDTASFDLVSFDAAGHAALVVRLESGRAVQPQSAVIVMEAFPEPLSRFARQLRDVANGERRDAVLDDETGS